MNELNSILLKPSLNPKQSTKSNHNYEISWFSRFRILCRRQHILSCFCVIISITAIFAFLSGIKLKYYEYLFKNEPGVIYWSQAATDQSTGFPQTPESFHSLNVDEKLKEALKIRARNGSNRYYLNDFEYFRTIRYEFPHSESARKLRWGHEIKSSVPSIVLNAQDVLFIITGSAKFADKAALLKETWLQWSQGNYFIFADAVNDTIPFITLSASRNETSKDEQHRQWLGAQWLIKNQSQLIKNIKWFVFADDDNWINVPALLSYLQYFDHRLLLTIGYISDDIEIPEGSFFSNNAGIVYSQAAFMTIIPKIYTNECPYQQWNDTTLMLCHKNIGITKIHSDRFFYEKTHRIATSRHLVPVSFVGKVTFYNMNNPIIVRRMTCDASVYWKIPIKGCEKVTRDNMPHQRWKK